MSARRLRVGALVALTAGLVLLLVPALPAGAHGAEGTMGIEVGPGPDRLTLKVRILLEYAGDREVAPGATVTATASGPGGATAGPVPLADTGNGTYEAVLTVPVAGAWTVTVSATNPAASAARVATARDATPLEIDTSTSGRLEGDLGTTTTAADDIEISSDRATQDDRRSDDGGTSPALVAAVAVVLVAAVGVVVVLVRGRRRTP